MTTGDIIAASEPMQVSGRFRRWFGFIIRHYSRLNEFGDIVPEGLSQVNNFKFAGLTSGIDFVSEGVDSLTPQCIVQRYSENYWWPSHGETLPNRGVGEMVSMMSVDTDLETSAYLFQNAMVDFGCKIIVDGRIGPKTIRQAWNLPDFTDLAMAIAGKAKARYKKLARNEAQDLIDLNTRIERIDDAVNFFINDKPVYP
jgi:hypothetical protein